ncbi:alpha/beta fold hydrolase [Solirubrobacter ginsenosidimutans]|uniref:Alpha/beta fold hydrolase n=1 Tax=Solirubrobacter ginsenosidimutans TaxID=490573 RepID=A0A9X3S334_9ACTN|nr:alpha/beta fold hydrolase [Solirubrobacter ginsenosidimutans]MDA0161701.1 alpha/beta fold hydrolase [Solirubrobacter ginsenosidimutans]
MSDAPIQAALDVMLTDGGGPHLVPPVGFATGLARRPHKAARRIGGLGAELARVAAGRSTAAPGKRDRRYADPAWSSSWLYRRILQAHLAVGDAADGLIDDAQLDWRAERQTRFAVGNLLDALAPSNFPLTNPAVVKAIVDQGGLNLVRGARNFAGDFPHLPSTVDTAPFAVGENLAVTPGHVVLRTEVFELIRYTPQTEQVHPTPVLFAPPTINKYYVLDLAPGRSLVEYLVGRGHQVFAISWRNPDAEQGHFDFDTYAAAILEARDTAAALTGSAAVHLNAACSGGILTAGLLGHLAAEGRLGEIASVTLMVAALDNARAGTTSAFTSREVAAAAVADSARRGYVAGEALSGVFAWLRPNDLVWNYVVNQYLLGKQPPAFDVLFWNQDTVRLAAGLHRDFIRLALDNALVEPGAMQVLGSAVDLGAVDLDSYVVAGLTDHIIPWENAYRSTQLLGGESRFVLSTSGHIQALVNPPGEESRASYRVAGENPETAEAWSAQAATVPGSWWPDYDQWLAARSGVPVAAPKIRNRGAKAPGSYVHVR